MKSIAVIAGDGTGPEVVQEGVKVLAAIEKKHNLRFTLTHLNYNASRYLTENITLTDTELDHLRSFDAILLGAIGDPKVKPGILEKEILLKIRFGLDQYINLRPIKLYQNVESPLKKVTPEDINYLVVRENSGGLYTGIGGCSQKNTAHEVASQSMIYTRHQVERCIRYAYEQAKMRHTTTPWKGLQESEIEAGFKAKLTLCGKSNVLTHVFDLWQRVFEEVGQEYPEIKQEYVHIDAICIYMVDCPQRFDVIVTSNMFGDIITDLGAITQGGLGVAPGANINPDGVSMFEPIGGTAPEFTGKNVINPLACIGSVAMMMTHFGYTQAAQDIESGIQAATLKMSGMAAGKMGISTQEVGTLVATEIQKTA